MGGFGSGRPGGNPGLSDYQFELPAGVKIPRDKTFAIAVEPSVHAALKFADKEKIRAAIVKSLLDQDIQLDNRIVAYYLSL